MVTLNRQVEIADHDNSTPPALDDHNMAEENGAAAEVPPPAGGSEAQTQVVTLEGLLERSKIPFDSIKGTARKGVVCMSLAQRAGIEPTDAMVQAWEQQWAQKLKAAEDAAEPPLASAAPPAAPAAPAPTPAPAQPGAPMGAISLEHAMQAASMLSRMPQAHIPAEPIEPHPETRGGRKGRGGGGGRRDDAPKKDHRKVFVGGLLNEVDERELSNVFGRFGKVVDADVKRDHRNGRSRGFAFVVYSTVSEAANAAAMQEITICGKRVEVQLAVPTGDPSLLVPRGADAGCKVFVGGLAQECTEEHLQQFFSAFGAIASTEIKRDHTNGRSRGFGFVTFHSSASAEDARKAPPIEICGKQVEVLESMVRGDPALESVQRGPDPRRKVFVGGLPQTLTESELQKAFSRFGEVTFTEIKRDFSNDRSRGFGFVIFASEVAADEALRVNALGGVMIDGKQVEVQPTLRKGDPALASRQLASGAPSGTPEKAPLEQHHQVSQAAPNMGGFAPSLTPPQQSFHGGAQGIDVTQLQALGRAQSIQPIPQQQHQMFTQLAEQQGPPLQGQPGSSAKIYVGGLSDDITAADLMSTFSLCGEVLTVDVKKDAMGRLKGYAFITFKDADSASRALAVPNPLVRNKNVVVRLPFSQPKGGGPRSGAAGGVGNAQSGPDANGLQEPVVLFVGNLPLEVDSISLIEEMSLHGPVLSADVPRDPTSGTSRGYGYVLFKNPATAEDLASQPKWSVCIKSSPVDIRKVSARNSSRGLDLAPVGGGGAAQQQFQQPRVQQQQQQPQQAQQQAPAGFGLMQAGLFQGGPAGVGHAAVGGHPLLGMQALQGIPGMQGMGGGGLMQPDQAGMQGGAMPLNPQGVLNPQAISDICRLLPLSQ